MGHDGTTAPLGTHQYFLYNLTQCCQDVSIHKQPQNDVQHSVIHTHTYSHHRLHPPPPNRNALLTTGCHCVPLGEGRLYFFVPLRLCNITAVPLARRKYCRKKVSVPNTSWAGSVKSKTGGEEEEGESVFLSDPKGGLPVIFSTLSPCVPSLSCAASWSKIRRRIPTVISQQQRRRHVARRRAILGHLCEVCGLWVWCRSSSVQVLPHARWLRHSTGSLIFFFYVSLHRHKCGA